MQLLKLTLGLLLFLIASVNAFSQNTGISDVNRNPDASAVLDVFSTSKGMLAPRMTEVQRTAIASPAIGLLVYQTNGTTPGFYYFTGSTWTPIAAGAGSQWTPEPSTNNIYYNAGSVGVGVASPTERLDIGGNLKLSGAFMPGNQAGTSGTVLQSRGTGIAPVWVDLTSPNNTYNWSLGGNNLSSLKSFGTISNFDLPVISNNVERMRITATGNIGIGTAAPFSPLHISVGAGGNLLYLHGRAGGPGSSAGIIFKTYGDINGAAGNPSAQINAIDDGNFSNHLAFLTKIPGADANALSERIRIASNGNVGIGVTTPAQRLDVSGNFNLSGAFMPGGSAGTTGYVLQSAGVNASPTWVAPGSSSNWALGGNSNTALSTLGTISNFDLPFITNNTEKMRLNTSGYLGLGIAAPASKIHVVTTGGTGAVDDDHTFDSFTGTGSGSTTVYYRHSRGTAASRTNLANGDQLLDIVGNGYINGAFTNSSSLRSYYAGSGTDNLSYLTLGTSNAERMRISPNGNIGIGTTTFDATNPEKLVVDAGTTTSVNAIYAKGSIDNYFQFNIRNLSNGTQASSDVVATASNGTETTNFINMGINGGGYVYQNGNAIETGKANDGYILSAGQDFYIVNNNATKDIIFNVGGTAIANEAMRITAAGERVGIGVTPTQKLDVLGNFKLTGAFMPNGVAGTAGQVLQSAGANTSPVWTSPANSSSWALGGNSLNSIQNLGTINAYDLPFVTNGAERMRILTNGNVGIGTATPSERLEVNGNVKIIGTAGGTRRLSFLGTVATNSTGSGDPDGVIEVRPSGTANEQQEMLFYMGNDNSVVSGGASYGPDRIRMVAEEFRFQTFNDPSASTIGNAEAQNGVNNRMVITAPGNVGIGTATPNSTLSVNGSVATAVRTVGGGTTISETDHVVINTGGAGTWMLPAAAAANQGRIYRLVNHGSGTISLSQPVYVSNGNNQPNIGTTAGSNTYEIISDGSVWRRID